MRMHDEFKDREKFSIQGTWGRLTAYKDTGVVIPAESDYAKLKHGAMPYKDIVLINVAELEGTYGEVPDNVDILDCGYWNSTNGKYEAPDDLWRNERG